jgi:hypothetical protein
MNEVPARLTGLDKALLKARNPKQSLEQTAEELVMEWYEERRPRKTPRFSDEEETP